MEISSRLRELKLVSEKARSKTWVLYKNYLGCRVRREDGVKLGVLGGIISTDSGPGVAVLSAFCEDGAEDQD